MTKTLKDKKLLVVDDNELNRSLITSFLKECDMNIVNAENGKDAIEILKKEKFDIIITDINMPEINGLELIKIIKNKLKLKTPIVIVTASDIKVENIDSLRIPIYRNDLIKMIMKNI